MLESASGFEHEDLIRVITLVKKDQQTVARVLPGKKGCSSKRRLRYGVTMMKSVVICEGNTDLTLIQYFLEKVYNWEFIKNDYSI